MPVKRPALARTANKRSATESSIRGEDHAGAFSLPIEKGCPACADASRLLGINYDADATTVKEAFRDLAKVWHPDRFGADEIRLKDRGEKQFKNIHAAYIHLHEHRPATVMSPPCDAMPLQEDVEWTTAKVLEIANNLSSFLRETESVGLDGIRDAATVLRKSISEQEVAMAHVQRLILRFEREMPAASNSQLKTMLTRCKQNVTKLKGFKSAYESRHPIDRNQA